MRKFFADPSQIKDGVIEIDDEENINHIRNVLRLDVGEEIKIGNKLSGESYICEISSVSKENVICKIIQKVDTTVESNINLTVIQGLPKADKMELIIQKGTELGVNKYIPVSFKRSIVKLSRKR